ncbi:MAG: hypothetical protein PHV68_08160, partial [Candidatus Gastranaerophilales bacterium]|nr:hypothetical protein [Candidatus Gastranaerophilales bacterium]
TGKAEFKKLSEKIYYYQTSILLFFLKILGIKQLPAGKARPSSLCRDFASLNLAFNGTKTLSPYTPSQMFY